MTRIKFRQTVAVLVAMCIAFACLAVSMNLSAKAEAKAIDLGADTGVTVTLDGATFTEAGDFYYAVDTSSYETVPAIQFTTTFENGIGRFTNESADEIIERVCFFNDASCKNENKIEVSKVELQNYTSNVDGTGVQFTLDLSNASGLEVGKTYWIIFAKDLTKTTRDYEGQEIKVSFTVNDPSTTTSTSIIPTSTTTSTTSKSSTNSSTSSTKSTRTVTTNPVTTTTKRTTATTKRVTKSANTGDESHLELYAAVAILAAGGFAILHIYRREEE